MDIEYSKNGGDAFTFTKEELSHLSAALSGYLPRQARIINAKIHRIENNPKNEGQVRYQQQIETLQDELTNLKRMANYLRP